ncbi:MAG: HesA/MoeB/ThiF family protein [Desulfitobacteriia bacterium]|jgi:molybdopterin/thiamine biosynthesis adenylyltransferase
MTKEKQPLRYQRNFNSLTIADQQKLGSSTVAIVGCGGLGGYIAEQLARLGVGHLILIDGDRIEESNLNRQLFALEENIGWFKVEAAKERLQKVNSSIKLDLHREWFSKENGNSLLKNADLVCDALDNAEARVEVERVCQELKIPFVFAAIGGWFGIVGVSYPGDNLAQSLFGDKRQGIEKELGNPGFTPAVIASLAVAEATKVLTGKPSTLQKSFLYVDLLNMEFNKFSR